MRRKVKILAVCMGLMLIIATMLTAFTSILVKADSKDGKAGDKITINAITGYDDSFKVNSIVPIFITVKNNYRDIKGELQVVAGTGQGNGVMYVQPLDISKGAEKTIIVNAYISQGTRSYEVRFVEGKDLLKKESKSVNLGAAMNTSFLGLLSDDFESINYINRVAASDGQSISTRIIKLNEDNFPETSQAMEMFDAIIINNFDTSKLSKEQYNGLKNWVKGGGALIIGTGNSYSKTLGAFKEDFIPGEIGSVKPINTSALSSFAASGKNNGSELIDSLDISLRGASKIVSEGDKALIQKVESGMGSVTMLSFDLGVRPFTTWENKGVFGERLLSVASPSLSQRSAVKGNGNSEYMLNNVMNSFSEMPVPKAKSFTLILFIYLLMTSPISYIILKKIDRRELMWVVVPSLALLFSLVMYVFGGSTRITENYFNVVSVVVMDKDGGAAVSSYGGIINSSKSDITVEAPTGAAIFPVFPQGGMQDLASNVNIQAKVYGREMNKVQFINNTLFDNRLLKISQPLEKKGRIEASINYFGGDITGNIRNAMDMDLEDCYIITPKYYITLGDIKRGESVEVKKSNLVTVNSYPQAAMEIYMNKGNVYGANMSEEERIKFMNKDQKRNIIDFYLQNIGYNSQAQTKFIGWSKGPFNQGFKLNGKKPTSLERNLIVAELKINYKNGSVVEYPSGSIAPQIISINGMGIDPYAGNLYGNGFAELSYSIDKDIIISSFELDTLGNGFNYSIWNNNTSQYEGLTGSVIDAKKNPQYVDKENVIRIKLQGSDKGGGQLPSMSLKGSVK